MGLWNNATTQSAATGTPNTWDQLFSETIGGGGIGNGQGLRLEGRVISFGTGSVGKARVTLDDVNLFEIDISPSASCNFDLTIKRVGTSGAIVHGTVRVDGVTHVGVILESTKSGLDWTAQQALKIEGYSNQTGATILQHAELTR